MPVCLAVTRMISKEKAHLIPAVYGSRQHSVTSGGGGEFLASIFGGGRMTTTLYNEQYVITDARSEHRTEQVAEDRYVNNVDAFQAQLDELIPQLSQQVQETTEGYLQAMMDCVQQSIHENFIHQLQNTVTSLQQDLATTLQRDAAQAARIRGELQEMSHSIVNLLQHLQENTPAAIVRHPLPHACE